MPHSPILWLFFFSGTPAHSAGPSTGQDRAAPGSTGQHRRASRPPFWPSFSSLWPVLAWICLALLLLDVAVRRLVLMPSTTEARNASISPGGLSAMRIRQVKRSKGLPETAAHPVNELPNPTLSRVSIDQTDLKKVDSASSNTPTVDKLSEEELHAAIDQLLGKQNNLSKLTCFK